MQKLAGWNPLVSIEVDILGPVSKGKVLKTVSTGIHRQVDEHYASGTHQLDRRLHCRTRFVETEIIRCGYLETVSSDNDSQCATRLFTLVLNQKDQSGEKTVCTNSSGPDQQHHTGISSCAQIENWNPMNQVLEFLFTVSNDMIHGNRKRSAELLSSYFFSRIRNSMTIVMWFHIRQGFPYQSFTKTSLWALLLLKWYAIETVN